MKYLLLSAGILLSYDSYANSGDERSQEIAAVFPLPSAKSLNQESPSNPKSDSTKKENYTESEKSSKNEKVNASSKRNLDMALRVAYFRPQDSRYRRIYHDGWA